MDKVAADTGVEDVVDKSCDDNVVIDNGNGEQEEENEAQAEELVESVVGNVADESKVEHVLEASKVMAKDLADLVAPQSESDMELIDVNTEQLLARLDASAGLLQSLISERESLVNFTVRNMKDNTDKLKELFDKIDRIEVSGGEGYIFGGAGLIIIPRTLLLSLPLFNPNNVHYYLYVP
eukprot:m.117875 g.117875  ORF g.117875 m.117875 type:complete len:180 (-) comp9333_c0_seq2:88-627(-)